MNYHSIYSRLVYSRLVYSRLVYSVFVREYLFIAIENLVLHGYFLTVLKEFAMLWILLCLFVCWCFLITLIQR